MDWIEFSKVTGEHYRKKEDWKECPDGEGDCLSSLVCRIRKNRGEETVKGMLGVEDGCRNRVAR